MPGYGSLVFQQVTFERPTLSALAEVVPLLHLHTHPDPVLYDANHSRTVPC